MRARRAACALALAVVTAAACSGADVTPPSSDSDTGAGAGEAWRWEAPQPASVGMPAADGAGVVASYGHSRLVHLDGEGRPLWEVPLDGLRDVAPFLSGDTVVAPTEDALVALDRATGRQRWRAEVPDRPNTPVQVGARVVTSTWEAGVVAVEADGAPAWTAPLPGPSLGPAAGGRDLVVATWDSGPLLGAGAVGIDPATGRERWRADLPGGGVSAPALSGGAVVVVAGDRAIHAFDPATGQGRWRVATPGGAGSPEVPPLPVAQGAVLAADRLGGLVLVGATGEVRWRREGEGAAVRGGPAGPDGAGRYALPVDDGRLLLAGPDGPASVWDPPGRVSGAAVDGRGGLVVATREAPVNALVGLRPGGR